MGIGTLMHFPEVRMLGTHTIIQSIHMSSPTLCISAVSVSSHRGPDLLLGSESIRSTRARIERTEHFHTPDHSVSSGHSLCSDIRRRSSQLCPHSLRSGVRLGVQQVRSAGS